MTLASPVRPARSLLGELLSGCRGDLPRPPSAASLARDAHDAASEISRIVSAGLAPASAPTPASAATAAFLCGASPPVRPPVPGPPTAAQPAVAQVGFAPAPAMAPPSRA